MSNFDRITGEQKKSIRNHGIIAVVLILIGVVVSIGKQVSGYISAILGVILPDYSMVSVQILFP